MAKIKELKAELAGIIQAALPAGCEVTTTIHPDTAEQMEELERKAKHEYKSVVYVTAVGKKFGDQEGKIYSPKQGFAVFIFSKHFDTDDEHDVEELLEKIQMAIYSSNKNYILVEDTIAPVQDKKTGLYMAVVGVIKNTIFPF